jgi:hypothetical protein
MRLANGLQMGLDGKGILLPQPLTLVAI